MKNSVNHAHIDKYVFPKLMDSLMNMKYKSIPLIRIRMGEGLRRPLIQDMTNSGTMNNSQYHIIQVLHREINIGTKNIIRRPLTQDMTKSETIENIRE